MVVSSSIRTCTKTLLHLRGHFPTQMSGHLCNVAFPTPSSSCCSYLKQGNSTGYSRISVPSTSSCLTYCSLRAPQQLQCGSIVSSTRRNCPSITVKSSVTPKVSQKTLVHSLTGYQNARSIISIPRRGLLWNFKCDVGPFSWSKGSVAAGLISGLLVCYSTSDSVHAGAREGKGDNEECDSSHGKKVYKDYSVTGIPGDGRCLFRSVAHGACLRSGKPAPSERLQKELADDLRARVADEFIRRRQETEWFIEGDFDTYVSHIRKPHVWGGEPELLMLSHVLRMPITVYMHDDKHGGLISIAEYGQEYGKDNPIRVLYHGFGHYDALLIPGTKGAKSRL